MVFQYYEDFVVGAKVESGTFTLEKDELIAFAERYDPQYMHIDEEAAKEGPIGRLIASGWQTAAICMRLAVLSGYIPPRGALGLGIDDLRWLAPVFPGDTLRGVFEVLEAIPSQKQPRGRVRTRLELFNQDGVKVLTMVNSAMISRRPAGADEGASSTPA